MTNRTMARHMKAAIELKAQIEELKAELEKHQDAIKAGMQAADIDEFTAAGHKATYKAVTSNRFDSSAFRKDHAALYDKYKKPSVSMRFCLS